MAVLLIRRKFRTSRKHSGQVSPRKALVKNQRLAIRKASSEQVRGLHQLGDTFLLHCGLQGIVALIQGKSPFDFIFVRNYFEAQAYGHYWFNP